MIGMIGEKETIIKKRTTKEDKIEDDDWEEGNRLDSVMVTASKPSRKQVYAALFSIDNEVHSRILSLFGTKTENNKMGSTFFDGLFCNDLIFISIKNLIN